MSFGDIAGNVELNRQLVLPVENFRVGAIPPDENLRGTTPSVPVLTFDAVAESACTGFVMPIDWDNGDFEIILEWALVNVQIDSDTLDVTIDYIAWEDPPNSGNNILKTSTQLTPQITVTTADGLAIGDVYRMGADVLAADADNPLANVGGFALEVHLTNITGVIAVDLLSVCISYTAKV